MNLDSAIALLSQYGLWAIFLIIMLEYACFPISSELVLPVSGLVAFRLGHRITLVILISVVAGLIGSSACYFAGRAGGGFLDRLFHRFPKAGRQFYKACDWQQRYGRMSIMLGRVVPLFRTYISFASGITRQNYLEFLLFSSIGILSWNTLLISCGYLLGENFEVILPYIKQYSMVILLLIAAVVLFAVWKKRKRRMQ